MHTNIVIFILIEMFISFRQYPSRKTGLRGLIIFMATYLVWIHIIKSVSGIWVYPVLEVLDFPQRIAFFLVNLVFCVFLYFTGEFVNNKLWSTQLKQLTQKSGKSKKAK